MDSQWLKTQFSLNPTKTKAGLAAVLGLEPPAISKILKGSRQIKAQEYAIMRRYFGLPVDGEGSLKQNKNAYVLEPLNRDEGLKDRDFGHEAEGEWVIPADILSQRTSATSNQIKVFEVKEHLMEPDFRHGERVLVDMSDKNPSPPGAFVVSDGFGYLIRLCEFVAGSQPPEVKVSAKATDFHPQVLKLNDFTIIGRVIAKLQWL